MSVESYDRFVAERRSRLAAVEAERAAWRSFLATQRDTLRHDRRHAPSVDRGVGERRADVLAARAYEHWQRAKQAVAGP